MSTWTKEKPMEVGWYWKRETWGEETDITIIYIREYARKLCMGNWAIPDDAEWAGPILKPKD